jgi:hypothetical protein
MITVGFRHSALRVSLQQTTCWFGFWRATADQGWQVLTNDKQVLQKERLLSNAEAVRSVTELVEFKQAVHNGHQCKL